MTKIVFTRSLIACSAIAISLASAYPAMAQAAAAEDESPSGEIIVTARKTNENILDTPIAISALTGDTLRERGVVSLIDVAAFTPGMKVSNNGGSRSDRATQQIILRGFTPPGTLAQTASVFIDGVPVSSALAVNNISNPARIEVLKGPQSAYFGRQTFAGAVNIVTLDPAQEWGGRVDAMGGTRDNYDLMGELTGPIVENLLSFRATVRGYGKGGSYYNYGMPSQRLGDQSTRTAMLSLMLTPSDRLTLKAYGMVTKNDDGPSAQGFISNYQLKNAAGTSVILANQSNCTLASKRPYICGVLPGLINQPSANNLLDPYMQNFLAQERGRVISPSMGVKDYGLVSIFQHFHGTISWEASDALTLSYLGGYNRDRNSVFADTDNYYDTTLANPFGGPGSRPYMDFPFLVEKDVEDHSHEGRANFTLGNFSGTFGASYLKQSFRSSLGGGNGGLGTTVFSAINGTNVNKTFGLFFGLNYKITPALTVSFDGRWQNDHVYVYTPPQGVTLVNGVFGPGGFVAGNEILTDKSYKNFTPRAIVQYDFAPGNMVYASFAQGVSPGQFNTQFFTVGTSIQSQLLASGYTLAVEPEKVTNYEIGAKGRLFNNRIRYSVAAYRALWKNQINQNNVSFIDSATGRLTGVVPAINGGRVMMTGVEAEVSADLSSRFQVQVTGSINDSSIRTLSAPTITTLTGISNFRGKENPATSKYAASVSGQYTAPLPAFDAEAFVRADYSFKSGVWSNAANIARTPNLSLVNVRAGLTKGPASFDVFVNNLFNTRDYTTVQDGSVFVGNFSITYPGSGLVVGLPDLRTFGVRAGYKF